MKRFTATKPKRRVPVRQMRPIHGDYTRTNAAKQRTLERQFAREAKRQGVIV